MILAGLASGSQGTETRNGVTVVLLAGNSWTLLAPSLAALADSGSVEMVELDGKSLGRAISEVRPSVIIASPDFDYSRLIRLKASKRNHRKLPPVLLCVTREAMEQSPDLYPGVDDFLVVPCAAIELTKRMRRLALTFKSPASALLRAGEIALDVGSYRVTVSGSPVTLAWMEFQLLKYLVENQGRVFTREHLLSKVWGNDHYGHSRTVDVHIRRLRFKLGSSAGQYLKIINSVGYGVVLAE